MIVDNFLLFIIGVFVVDSSYGYLVCWILFFREKLCDDLDSICEMVVIVVGWNLCLNILYYFLGLKVIYLLIFWLNCVFIC